MALGLPVVQACPLPGRTRPRKGGAPHGRIGVVESCLPAGVRCVRRPTPSACRRGRPAPTAKTKAPGRSPAVPARKGRLEDRTETAHQDQVVAIRLLLSARGVRRVVVRLTLYSLTRYSLGSLDALHGDGAHATRSRCGRCEAQPMRSASETMIPSGPRT
jgi:hypothetical protein